MWKYRLHWDSPSAYKQLRWWAFGIWNEYDDWLYNGVHGFRVLGWNVDMVHGRLEKFLWRILPVIRFFNRRPERP